jgi:hypothetical protein
MMADYRKSIRSVSAVNALKQSVSVTVNEMFLHREFVRLFKTFRTFCCFNNIQMIVEDMERECFENVER